MVKKVKEMQDKRWQPMRGLLFKHYAVNLTEDFFNQICQLFPKSLDNPDGFEPNFLIPKPLEGTPYIKDIGEFVDSARLD